MNVNGTVGSKRRNSLGLLADTAVMHSTPLKVQNKPIDSIEKHVVRNFFYGLVEALGSNSHTQNMVIMALGEPLENSEGFARKIIPENETDLLKLVLIFDVFNNISHRSQTEPLDTTNSQDIDKLVKFGKDSIADRRLIDSYLPVINSFNTLSSVDENLRKTFHDVTDIVTKRYSQNIKGYNFSKEKLLETAFKAIANDYASSRSQNGREYNTLSQFIVALKNKSAFQAAELLSEVLDSLQQKNKKRPHASLPQYQITAEDNTSWKPEEVDMVVDALLTLSPEQPQRKITKFGSK